MVHTQETRRGLSRRRLVQAGLAAAALAGTGMSAACGAGGEDKNTWSFFSWDGKATMQPVLDLFHKQYPNLKVEFSNAPPVDQYISTLQTRLQANTAADVYIFTAENKQLADGGFVKDLSGQAFLDVMNSANRGFMTRDDKVWGLSISSWAGGILYNKALLAKVGASGLPDSWDGFLALCRKLKQAGITPYYDSVQDGNFMSLWGLLGGAFADAGHFPDDDIFAGKTTFAATWPDAVVAYSRLYTEGLVPKSVLGLTGDQVVSEFTNGRVAMFGAGTWNIPTIQKAAPKLQFQTSAVPGLNAGTLYWSGAASPGYAVNAKAKNAAAAMKFVKFMSTAPAVEAYAKASGSITTTSNYQPTVDAALADFAKGARSGKIYLPVVAWPKHANDLSTELKAQMQQMIQGKVAAKDIPGLLDKKLAQLEGK